MTDAYSSASAAVNRLAILLNDPHPGLMTWHSALADARLSVMRELTERQPNWQEMRVKGTLG